MMVKKNTPIFFLVFFLIPIMAKANSGCIPYSDWIPGIFGGGFQMKCNICENEMECTSNYQNFSSVPGVISNGTVSYYIEIYNFLWYSVLKVTFYGGPIYYNVDNETYEVFFKNLFFDIKIYGRNMEVSDVGGGIVANGYYIPADPIFFDFLF